MTIEARKHRLISKITRLKNEEDISRLEIMVNNLIESESLLEELAKPMRKELNLEDLIEEQKFKGVDREKFDALIKEMDIQEPIEKLLSEI